MSQKIRSNILAPKYSPAKDIFFLIMFLSALIITFLNLPGILAVAYYDENFQPLAVRQC